ncbi:MAG: MerR family transcriptional regulator [Acidipila sp.]|nr:MerR family transcriptional regulator [Acidipila sp.]
MNSVPQLTISELAQRVGLRPSAIRYYERIGILLPAQRIRGQRRYDLTDVHRLAVVQRARQSGFTLGEIRRLFFGFREGTRASQRWHRLSRQKLAELDTLSDGIHTLRGLLKRMMKKCRCDTLEHCGKRILENGCKQGRRPSLPANNRHNRRHKPVRRTVNA